LPLERDHAAKFYLRMAKFYLRNVKNFAALELMSRENLQAFSHKISWLSFAPFLVRRDCANGVFRNHTKSFVRKMKPLLRLDEIVGSYHLSG
jgi:hypothetical protein